MKIDLHCHTKKVKSGDGTGRNIDATTFVNAVQDAGVEIVAITNHDHFDLLQFREFAAAAKDSCEVWPGTELDMQGDHEWHLIMVCDPNEAEAFSEHVLHLVGSTPPDKVCLTVGEVVECLDCLNVIYIPHAHGKRSGKKLRDIPDEQRNELISLVGNPRRIIFEPHHHSLGVLSKHGYRVILGSDVKDWNCYKDYQVSDLRFPISSFAAFCRLAEGDVDTYNDIILGTDNGKPIVVTPVENAKPRSLTLYRGVNVIFGQKGTGKTKLILAIDTALRNIGAYVGLYRAAEARPQYESELIPNWDECSANKVGADICNDQFNDISQWHEEKITSFSSYIDYAQGTEASKNRKRLVIADVGRSEPFNMQNELNSVSADKKRLSKAMVEINQIDISSYVDKTNETTLYLGLNALILAVNEKHKELVSEKYAAQLLTFSITKIKEHAEALCGSPSSPNGTGFREFIGNRLILMRSCKKILANVDGRSNRVYEEFGELEDKGDILMETTYLMFKDNTSDAKCFNGNKTRLLEAKKALKGVCQDIWEADIADKVDDMNDKFENGNISSTDAFVGVKKQTVIRSDEDPDTYNPYEPSDGELAIIMIRRFLSEDHEFYLLDEPEKGMGNSYIDVNIRPDIINLADRKKTVVLATHNANLAIRTMPVYTMLAEYHEKGDYAIYRGSPFSNLLVNMDDSLDVQPWAKTSMTILEGGEEAFYDRKDMYELDK